MKVKSKARQVRLEYQARLGRPVPLSEVAEEANIDRMALTRLERGEISRVDLDIVAKLCAFYKVGIAEILEYDPDGIRALGLVEAAIP